MPQGIFRGAIQLKLHDVYVTIGLYDEVDTTVWGVVFHLGVKPDQSEDNEKYILVMQLRVSFRLLAGDHLVRGVGEEALQATEESVVITILHLPDKTPDFERSLWGANTGVERKQVFDKAFFYL